MLIAQVGNKYVYCANNPVMYSDPSGNKVDLSPDPRQVAIDEGSGGTPPADEPGTGGDSPDDPGSTGGQKPNLPPLPAENSQDDSTQDDSTQEDSVQDNAAPSTEGSGSKFDEWLMSIIGAQISGTATLPLVNFEAPGLSVKGGVVFDLHPNIASHAVDIEGNFDLNLRDGFSGTPGITTSREECGTGVSTDGVNIFVDGLIGSYNLTILPAKGGGFVATLAGGHEGDYVTIDVFCQIIKGNDNDKHDSLTLPTSTLAKNTGLTYIMVGGTLVAALFIAVGCLRNGGA